MSGAVLVVGRGALGRLVTRILREAGFEVNATPGREPSPLRVRAAATILLAVPDPAIRATAERITPYVGRGAVVLHAAGSRTIDELASVANVGAHVGVMHPLVSFARGARPRGFEGAITVIDGDRRAVVRARAIARALGTKSVVAPVHGATYHAAAALAANGAVALVNEAAALLVGLGFSRRDAELGLAGILGTVVANVREVGVPEALTGPIARGDATTVGAHREALAESPRALATYDGIAPAILRCSVERGLPRDAAADVAAALDAVIPPRRRSQAPRRRSAVRPRRRGA